MKVADIMTASVFSVEPSTRLRDIWKDIVSHRINSIPVVNKKNQLVGLITKDDLLQKLYPEYGELMTDFSTASDFEDMEKRVKELGKLTVAEVMKQRVIFTRSHTFAMRALSRMIAQRVNQLPVLDEHDCVIGMITKGDVFSALFRFQLSKGESAESIDTVGKKTTPAGKQVHKSRK